MLKKKKKALGDIVWQKNSAITIDCWMLRKNMPPKWIFFSSLLHRTQKNQVNPWLPLMFHYLHCSSAGFQNLRAI